MSPDAGIRQIIPVQTAHMGTVMLAPYWLQGAEAIIEQSLLNYWRYADEARRLGSNLMTDSFLENVMMQKLDYRLSPHSSRPVSCHGAARCAGMPGLDMVFS